MAGLLDCTWTDTLDLNADSLLGSDIVQVRALVAALHAAVRWCGCVAVWDGSAVGMSIESPGPTFLGGNKADSAWQLSCNPECRCCCGCLAEYGVHTHEGASHWLPLTRMMLGCLLAQFCMSQVLHLTCFATQKQPSHLPSSGFGMHS